ncbi:GNAT family N-acetyltransferase [Microbispora sp. NBC_01389]|uniref:GNAT family N-acetyltransferase n=1 Tax=Microbispora sp. NBC_01389 TaxID=2903584 RepID=UPI00325374D1
MTRSVAEACDVLLRDGGMARIRPLRPSDRAALHALIARSSPRSAYLRFFAGGTASAHAYMDLITGPDYGGHALVALAGGLVAGVAEWIPGPGGAEAEVGILLDDRVHGQGLGTLLLEHVALDAADAGVEDLVATVLPENRAMLRVLHDLGLPVEQRYERGQVEIRIAARPTERLVAEIEARAHEAERGSLAHVFTPGSVAVIGDVLDPGGLGNRVLRDLVAGRFPGPIHPVDPRAAQASPAAEVCGLPVRSGVAVVPGPVDLAVVAVPAPAVLGVARECARRRVRALVVLTGGFTEAGDREAERELPRVCREAGMRLVGPGCLGVVNTSARLHAGLLPVRPAAGPLGLMAQSGTAVVALLEGAGRRGLGVSSFASVGDKADVSGNDLLEYWEDDPATRVIALHLESFGNPRRFRRIARRIGTRKPIIVTKARRDAPESPAATGPGAASEDAAVDALLRACGAIREDSVRGMLDTARLLASQPLPDGPRVAIVSDSGPAAAVTAGVCERAGLVVADLCDVGDLAVAITAVLADPGVDAVLVVSTPPSGPDPGATREAIAAVTRAATKPVLACLAGWDGLIDGRIPAYASPERAAHALARAHGYAAWRARPVPPPEELPGVDPSLARRLVAADLAAHPGGRLLDDRTAARLLAAYGVHVAETVAATVPGVESGGGAEGAEMVVRGVACETLGPLVMVGPGGTASGPPGDSADNHADDQAGAQAGAHAGDQAGAHADAQAGDQAGEHAFRVPPIDRAEARRMIGEARRAALPNGHQGLPEAGVRALEDQIVRVGRLMDDHPGIAAIDLDPVVVTPYGVVVVRARVRLAPAPPLPSPFRRRLR